MKSNNFNQWLKQLPKPIRFVVVIVLIIAAAIFKEDVFPPSSIQLEEVTLKRVVDGDTIIVINKNKEELRVRLIGIDTPESVHPDADKNTAEGQLASDYTKSQLKNGQTLYLEFDEEHQDKYGRNLAYVWLDNQVNSNNIEDIAKNMYNAKLIVDGYAVAKRFPPNTKYAEIFDALQNR
ncbi:MAG: thermonuclease family protein [Turicibacter sp.]|nr:thermonuclease family protein [Turicibacter sp.]